MSASDIVVVFENHCEAIGKECSKCKLGESSDCSTIYFRLIRSGKMSLTESFEKEEEK